jgi:energy-converting hydrogenase Eha subunit C
MISLGPAKEALSKIKPPSPDAAFLNASMDLAKEGKMFQNPLDSAMGAIDGLGIDSMTSQLESKASEATSMAATLDKQSGVWADQVAGLRASAKLVIGEYSYSLTAQADALEKLIAENNKKSADLTKAAATCTVTASKYSDVASQAAALKQVSTQMFTSTTSTKAAIPPALMNVSGLAPDDLGKLKDISIPSITDVMSAVSSEQSANEQTGQVPADPCLPVQKSMESTMSAATKMNAALDDLKNSGAMTALKSGMSSIKSAVGGIDLAVSGVADKLGAAVSAASAGLDDHINKLSSAVNDMGKSLMGSINSVQKSVEKSMQLATADMAKSLVSSNPCMKNVLSPGSGAGAPGSVGVYEYKTKFRFRNVRYPGELKEDDNGKYAALLANSANLKYNTVLNSMGHETWDCSCVVVSHQSNTTIVECEITYTIDIDKAIKNYVTFFDNDKTGEKETIDNISFIKFYEDGDVIGSVLPQIVLKDAKTAPKIAHSDLNWAKDFLVLDGDILWSGGKKPSLLSPEMQQISQPAEEKPLEDLPVTTEPAVVKTVEQVKQEEEAEKVAMTPPVVQAEPTKVIAPPAKVTPAPQPPFKKSVEMTKEITPKSSKWKEVHSVTTSADKIVGSLMVMLSFNPGAPPTINYKYQMDSWQIDEIIAQIMGSSKSGIGGDLHFDNIKITYLKKDGTEFGHSYMSFYMNYYAPTQQMGIQTGYAAGDSEGYDFKWDWTQYKDDK